MPRDRDPSGIPDGPSDPKAEAGKLVEQSGVAEIDGQAQMRLGKLISEAARDERTKGRKPR